MKSFICAIFTCLMFIHLVTFEIQAKLQHKFTLRTLVFKHSGKMFLVAGHQVWAHLWRDFDPLLFTETQNPVGILAAW